MNAIAPVCPISRSQPVSGSPGLLYPVLPVVVDLPSAIAAVNMLAPYLTHLGGIPYPINNVYPPAASGHTALKNNNSAGIAKHNWVENLKKRQVTKKRIYQGDYGNGGPSSQDIYVDVVRLMHMEMRDMATGWTLVWDYGSG